jgi:respiratory burst oxidase
MNYFEYKHIIVIGSGIGVTPLMSIWKYLIQKGTSTTLGEKSVEGSTLTFDTSSYNTYDEDNNVELNEQTLLEQEQSEQQHQQKTMLRKISIKIEKVLESVTISMFLLLFFVMGETIAIVMQMFTFSNGANLFGSFMSIIALIVHGCNVIVSTIVVGPYLYIRLFKFWLEVCIIVVDSFALWISLIGYMYPNSYSQRANNTTYFCLFGVVVVLHAIRIFHIFYTTLKPPKDNNTNNNNNNNSFDNGSNQMCSIQGILINKYYSGMRFAAKSLMPPLGSKLFSMEFYGTREKPELKDVSGREEEIITDLMGKSEFVRISSFNSLTEIQNQNNNRGGSSTKQENYLSFKCGRPDWRHIFLKAMAKAHAQTNNDKNSGSKVSRGESVGVFFCGSPAITADLQTMAKEVTAQHQFTKKHLDGKACKCKLIVHSENF